MAAVLQSQNIVTNQPALTPSGAHDVVWAVADYTFATAPVINDLVEMIILPAGCVPVDMILDTDDLDGGAALTVSVGTMAGDVGDTTLANRTLTANMLADSTAQRAPAATRANVAGFTRIAPSSSDRAVGLKITAAAASAGTGTARLSLAYRPAIRGI